MVVRWKHVLLAFLAAVILGSGFAWSGLMGVGARSGHWAVTDWFLHWVMRNSVRTAALQTEPPPFDNPEMLKLAAGHYEQGCAFCHGSPAGERSAVSRNMLPEPPDLKEKVPEWTKAELFHIVQDGVRFTGMPAWPAPHRKTSVVDGGVSRAGSADVGGELSPVGGLDATGGSNAVLDCQSCHAPERLNGKSLIPSLAGQSETYLRESLFAYADGRRLSGVMQTAIAGLSKEQLASLAGDYASMQRVASQTMTPILEELISIRAANLLKKGERQIAFRRVSPATSGRMVTQVTPSFQARVCLI